ncbi:MAG: lytic transglycosylase domain-containing protein [Deltaproteobacteria bacterium]|nr:lytic transglycosylase domain-containing protein [Deltaproteobacteria bacterium]
MVNSPALADIFLYIDQEGIMHFTNVPTHHRYRVFLRERSSNHAKTLRRYKSDSNRYNRLIEESSRRYGVDYALVKAIIRAESGFDAYAISTKGAEGLMQLMPKTSKKLNVLNPFDPRENIEGGVRHLQYLLKRFDQDLKLSLAAYNAGETVVAQFRGVPNYRETKNYIAEVLSYYSEYKNNSTKGNPVR